MPVCRVQVFRLRRVFPGLGIRQQRLVNGLGLAMMAGFLESLGWSMHFTYSRAWVKTVYGDNYAFILRLAAAETIPAIVSILGGMHGDVAGRRRVAVISMLQAPLFALIPLAGLEYMPLLVVFSAGLWSYFWPNLVASVMELTGMKGYGYARFAVGQTLGWGTGGLVIMALDAASKASPPIVYTTASLSLAAAGLVGVQVMSGSGASANASALLAFMRSGRRRILALLVAVSSMQTASELFWNSSSFKLYTAAGGIKLFSLAYSVAPTLIGAAARPPAGRLVDRLGPGRMLLACIMGYAVLYAAVYAATGPILMALWIIPLFALYDTSMYTLAARVFPESLQGSASGLVVISYFVSGLTALLLSGTGLGYGGILMVSELLASIAALSLIAGRLVSPIDEPS